MVSTVSIVCLLVGVVSNVAAQYRSGCECGSYAPGTYSVSLPNCGPPPCLAPPLSYSQVAPTCVQPTVALPSPCIPPPQTISNVCQCQKVIIKPQVYTNTVTVPSVQKYVRTSYQPVFETINYQAVPQCPCQEGYAGYRGPVGYNGYAGYNEYAGYGGYDGYGCGSPCDCEESYPISNCGCY